MQSKQFSKCLTEFLIYLILCAIICAHPSQSLNDSEILREPKEINSTVSLNSTSPAPHNLSSSSYDDYDYYTDEEAKRIRDNSKIAQIVVYFSVIFIALFGILIKYFVMQYEKSQLKAQEQLSYQRLQHA